MHFLPELGVIIHEDTNLQWQVDFHRLGRLDEFGIIVHLGQGDERLVGDGAGQFRLVLVVVIVEYRPEIFFVL